MAKLLTKSKYLNGLQCHKLLWYVFNKPEVIPEYDAATLARFEQGHIVGDMAKTWWPEGVEVERTTFKEMIRKTEDLISQRKTIFEATIVEGNLYAHPDILTSFENDKWDVIEVKSANSIKDVNYEDLAFQKYLYEKHGLKINKTFLMHLNGEYIKQGPIDWKKILIMTDVTDKINDFLPPVEHNVKMMFDTIKLPQSPTITIGGQCKSPYLCPLKDICWDFLPPFNITQLHGIWMSKAKEYIEQGIISYDDINDNLDLKLKHRLQISATKQNQPYIDNGKVKEFVDSLKYPLYFLDFESINPAIPLFDGTSSHQQVTFQFSLHIKESPESELKHIGYIFDDDPRKKILDKLKETLGESGSILVYYEHFEKARLRDMAKWFPEETEWIKSILSRIVDLIKPFQQFYYYHPDQKGSCSIKYVLPALTDISYEGMLIAEGNMASLEYLRVTQTNVGEAEKKSIFNALEEYCKLDTYAMVEILNKLRDVL